MKNINAKSVMIFTLLIASAMATPVMAAGYGNDDDNYNLDQISGISSPDQLLHVFGGFGSIFSGLGYGGEILSRVFGMLFMQTLSNFSDSEMMPGVYAISASSEETHNGTRNYGTGTTEYYMPPQNYNQSIVKEANQGYAYCEVTKQGYVDYSVTIGAGVTLLIYDHDKSFITALQKVLDFINTLKDQDLGNLTQEQQQNLIHDGIQVLTWFLIHINDIFTGDELFALNPITWQTMKITPGPGFNVTKTWMVTGPSYVVNGPGAQPLASAGIAEANTMLTGWNNSAKASKDSYMEWLLSPTNDASLVQTYFTAFTFDLLQLWMKNFEIHIDAGAIVDLINGMGNNGPVNVADIFKGCDIEFYLFTHHLGGVFLYNDSNGDGMLSSSYRDVTVGGNTLTLNGTAVQVPYSSEVTHRIMLGTVGSFTYETPHKTGANKISWGLTLNNATIVPVPVGVDLDSYLGAKEDHLQYIHFGFSFEPSEVQGHPGILYAPIKLDQNFAPWNNLAAPHSNNDISGLNLAIVYLSTMLHFHLHVTTTGENQNTILDPAQDYNNQTHTLKVGNYLGKAFQDELAFVDIAGKSYEYGVQDEALRETAKANSSIIPLALYEAEVQRHDTFQDETGQHFATFATDIQLNVSFNVMTYAVCFPEFNNGNGIWHDPTFSVYMVFEAQSFWALILLIAGVGLVGIATILIKRRKDARF